MIPVYNCADYLRRTLASVLPQAPASAQIEVVDDCSTRDDPEAVVREAGDSRVTFVRQPVNLGAQATFTTCIVRAHGEWVHILHGDDLVAPGFYDAFQAAAEQHPEIGAAFCRSTDIDDNDDPIEVMPAEAAVPGILSDLADRLAVYNLIRFPSIVVRRQTYERVGGFHPALFHSADWDMWKRVALNVPVWYDPTPLALYRVHARSDTSALMRTGANIADALRAIEIADHYLPRGKRADLSRRARLYHALYAVEVAEQMAARGSWPSALAQVREGLRCSHSAAVVRAVARAAWKTAASHGRRLLKMIQRSRAGAGRRRVSH
jgi:glycosyltransferase involved in cell wall biosynthesis